jgi:HlyD family secretion protein
MDTVKRGEMLRQVRGNGVLVPEEIRWIPSINPGRVERILVLPGARVKADTVLVELRFSKSSTKGGRRFACR